MNYSSYSPNLSPCDYYLFGLVKEKLGGHHFDEDGGVDTFVCN